MNHIPILTKDGTTIRDYIHVEDLAKIHLLASKLVLRKKVFKIFNCGYGNGFSVMEILRKFLELTPPETPKNAYFEQLICVFHNSKKLIFRIK